MKVDEFVTIYKLLTEQNFYTLPFCLLAVYGLLDLLFGLARKRFTDNGRLAYGVTYAILLIASLIVLILKRNADEDLRKDALRIKQYIDLYASDYEGVAFSRILQNVDNVDNAKIEKIADRFPNDFVISQQSKCSEKLLILLDPVIMGPHKCRMKNLTYLKLRGALKINDTLRCDALFKKDNRITNTLVEAVCASHPDEFVIEPDLNDKANFNGWIRRIK